MVINKFTGIYFGCTDPFGENDPDAIFNEKIYPILKRYNLTDDAIKVVAKGIRDMCKTAYSNGVQSEAFCNNEGC